MTGETTDTGSTGHLPECSLDDLGLDQPGYPVGPAFDCFGAAATGHDWKYGSLAVLQRPGIDSAEDAFAALAEGLTEAERSRGFGTWFLAGMPTEFTLSRPEPGHLRVEIPLALVLHPDANDTSAGSMTFVAQIVATAFGDPTVEEVTIAAVDEDGTIHCMFMEMGPDCIQTTRADHFTWLTSYPAFD